MSGTSNKSNLPTSGDSPNVTSSPASASGATPLETLAGQMILPCGAEAVPARVSVRAGKGAASQISVIYGLHGSGSLASAALTQSLANRLRAKTDLLGSTLFRLTWKERVTPSGRRIPALRASGHRTSEADCTSWPTATVNDATGSEYAYANGNHDSRVLKLPGAAKLCGWQTPKTPTGGGQESRRTPGGGLRKLEDQAQLAS